MQPPVVTLITPFNVSLLLWRRVSYSLFSPMLNTQGNWSRFSTNHKAKLALLGSWLDAHFVSFLFQYVNLLRCAQTNCYIWTIFLGGYYCFCLFTFSHSVVLLQTCFLVLLPTSISDKRKNMIWTENRQGLDFQMFPCLSLISSRILEKNGD